MINISFRHGIGDKVFIPELERPGFVQALYYGETGSKYLVSYFDEASKKQEYFSDKEIKPFREAKFGFKTNKEPEPTVTKSPVKIY